MDRRSARDGVSASGFPALLGPILDQRPLAATLALVFAAQVALTALRLPGWPCVFREVTGLPCPGCGLSRALAALVHGAWGDALRWHAFAPVAAVAGALLVAAALLPAPARRRLSRSIETLERRTGLAVVLGAAALLYWLARLLYTPLAPFPGR